jgi:hypothetical protein
VGRLWALTLGVQNPNSVFSRRVFSDEAISHPGMRTSISQLIINRSQSGLGKIETPKEAAEYYKNKAVQSEVGFCS